MNIVSRLEDKIAYVTCTIYAHLFFAFFASAVILPVLSLCIKNNFPTFEFWYMVGCSLLMMVFKPFLLLLLSLLLSLTKNIFSMKMLLCFFEYGGVKLPSPAFPKQIIETESNNSTLKCPKESRKIYLDRVEQPRLPPGRFWATRAVVVIGSMVIFDFFWKYNLVLELWRLSLTCGADKRALRHLLNWKHFQDRSVRHYFHYIISLF